MQEDAVEETRGGASLFRDKVRQPALRGGRHASESVHERRQGDIHGGDEDIRKPAGAESGNAREDVRDDRVRPSSGHEGLQPRTFRQQGASPFLRSRQHKAEVRGGDNKGRAGQQLAISN